MARKTLYLIDGHAQIYRAYYAPFRPLTSPSGEPTRATFVFCQMLLNLLRDRRPDCLAMVMDVSDETVFRVEIDPEYKAHREPPPEDMSPQIERIVQIVEALGIPILRMQGYEADDILATLCRRHAGREADVFLVSKDKDLEQLLRDGVRLYDPGKDEVIDAESMAAAKGYPPAKAIEAQMLIGDSVDNIRGVTGVGPKKAAELLAKYGDVAGIIAHADELSPKLRENVLEFAGRAERVRRLVTLKDDVPIEFSMALADVGRLRGDAALPLFVELGFHRLTEQLKAQFGGAGSAAGAAAKGGDKVATVGTGAAKPADRTERGTSVATVAAGEFDEAAGTLFARELTAAPSEADERVTSGAYQLIESEPALRDLAKRLRGVGEFAFDTETTSLTPADAELCGISISWEAGKAYYVAVRGVGQTLDEAIVRDVLGPIFADERIGKCGQNMKYDIGVLMTAGIEMRGVRFDTMIASFVLDSNRRSHGIDALALDLLGIRKIATSELIGRGKEQLRFDQLDTRRVCAYACEDADVAWRLKELFEPQIAARGQEKLFYELEMPLVEVLATMEHHGVALDTDLLGRISNEMAQRLKQLTDEIHTAAGCAFNIDSTKQLADVLFDRLMLPVQRRTKTGRSTDAGVLSELASLTKHPVPKLVLEYRELTKLKGTYVDTLPEMVSPRTGRVHCSFHQTGAVTGRLSSSDPNLQNIPIRTEAGAQIRRAFVPRARLFDTEAGTELSSRRKQPGDAAANRAAAEEEWVLMSADYSQIELRVLAHFCGDENLCRAFREDRDIHAFVASQIFNVPIEQVGKEQRGRAKTVNFGIIYGQTAFGLSRQTGMSQNEARQFIEAYFRQYPGIQAFLDRCIEQARKHGFVETMLGRRRRIDDIHSRNQGARQGAERLAVNTVVQGTAADIIKRAMINIHRRMRDEGRPLRMLIQVHDELVFELPKSALADEARMVCEEMSGAIPLSVPVKVDVAAGKNWLDGEEIA